MRKYETGIPPGKCGIYGIGDKELGYIYVGKAKDIHSRIRNHIVQSIKIEGSGLYKNDIDSFMGEKGWENFEFSILIECSLENIDYYEQYFYEKCGGEKLRNIESPKNHAGIGTLYALTGFLKSRAMYYVCKLIDENSSFLKCIEDLTIDYLKKEDELRDNLVSKFGYSPEELKNYCKSSRKYGDVIKSICEYELVSVLEKISDVVSQDSSYKLIHRDTKKFMEKEKINNDIEKRFVNDIKIGILSLKDLNYQSYYDKKILEVYYTIDELIKADSILKEFGRKKKA